MLALFLGLAARAAHLSLWDPRAEARGDAQVLTALALAPERGVVVDREGAELALTLDAPSVYAVPAEVRDAAATARSLAQALAVPAGPLLRRLREPRPFAFVARWVDADRAERVRRLALPGIGVLSEPRRTYPNRELAGTLLGFANIDGVGVRGVERLEDSWLRGRPRRVPVERDARGRLLVGPGLDPHAAAGGDVALTLDAALQAEAEAALGRAVEASGARGGCVVVLDPVQGDVLALAERPAFDPNRFRSVAYPRSRSRAFLDALEPGSTLKMFVVAAALEAGVLEPDDVIDLEGGILRVPGKVIRDREPHDTLDVASVLRLSSNVGSVRIAQRVGARRHFEALRRFGFGAATGSGFPEESSGLLRSWRQWKPLDHATIAFGQGVNATPIQLAVATAALANGGVRVRPRLVNARREAGGTWEPVPVASGERVVSARTAAQLVAMLESAAGAEGTGRRAALAGVRVAGKTGTAQKLDAETGTYAPNRYLAWFAGVAPADAPRVAVVAVLDEPGDEAHTGGAVAAPLFARVAAARLTRIGIATEPLETAPRLARKAEPERVASVAKPAGPAPPAEPAKDAPRPPVEARVMQPREPQPRTKPVAAGPPSVVEMGDRILLPDLRGLTEAEVRRVDQASPLQVEFVGRGRVVSQEPEPGSILPRARAHVRVRFARAGGEG